MRFIIVFFKADYREQILLVNLVLFLDYTLRIYAPASLFRAQMLKPQDISLILRSQLCIQLVLFQVKCSQLQYAYLQNHNWGNYQISQ